MSYVVLDASDVVELAEMLEYIVERLDTLIGVDASRDVSTATTHGLLTTSTNSAEIWCDSPS